MWIVNALSIVCSEMLKLSRNNQNIKMLGVPPNTLPLVIYIGIFCYWVLLHYNISFKTIAGGFNGAFWWYGRLSEDQEKIEQIYQNYLVALTLIPLGGGLFQPPPPRRFFRRASRLIGISRSNFMTFFSQVSRIFWYIIHPGRTCRTDFRVR